MQKQPLPKVPIVLHVLKGYLRVQGPQNLVLFDGVDERFLFHDLPPRLAQLLRPGGSWNSKLQKQLAQATAQLRDIQVDEQGQEVQQQQQEQPQPQKPWRRNVRLQRVKATGPASRAYKPTAQQQLQAVVAAKDIDGGDLIGLYLGYVYDGARFSTEVTTAERTYLKYMFDFGITQRKGSRRVAPCQQQQQQQQRSRAAAAASRAAFTNSFIVDAGPCLVGNPLAHMLDYRAFTADWERDDCRSVQGGANAALVPVSDNSTGLVLVAVVALRDIKADGSDDICIDYGEHYWDVVCEDEQHMQLARQQLAQRLVDRQVVTDLKQQLKQQADQLATEAKRKAALRYKLHMARHESQQWRQAACMASLAVRHAVAQQEKAAAAAQARLQQQHKALRELKAQMQLAQLAQSAETKRKVKLRQQQEAARLQQQRKAAVQGLQAQLELLQAQLELWQAQAAQRKQRAELQKQESGSKRRKT